MAKAKFDQDKIMKWAIIAAAVIVLAVIGFKLAAKFIPQTQKPKVDKEIILSREELKKKMEKDEDFYLVDVLSKESYEKGHIKGAVSLPLGEIRKRAPQMFNKDDELVVYCASFKCMASTKAAKTLRAMGYENVYDYKGGLADWKEADLPTASGKSPIVLKKKKLSDKKALILSADGFEDSELLYPYFRLQEAGLIVHVASVKTGQIKGKHGYSVDVDLTFAEAKQKDYDILVIPGGQAPETVRLNGDAIGITQDFMEVGKPVAAICHGPQVLISAGQVLGRKMTSWKGIRDDLMVAGALYENSDVVVDQNLVTSRYPADLPAFARELMKKVKGK